MFYPGSLVAHTILQRTPLVVSYSRIHITFFFFGSRCAALLFASFIFGGSTSYFPVACIKFVNWDFLFYFNYYYLV